MLEILGPKKNLGLNLLWYHMRKDQIEFHWLCALIHIGKLKII